MTSTISLKRVAKIIPGQSPPSTEVSELTGAGRPFLQGNAEFGSLYPRPHLQCVTAPKQAETNDILLSVRAPVGALNIADRPYGIGRGLCAVRPLDGLDPKFAWWALVATAPLLSAVATGSTYDAVTADNVGHLSIPQLALTSQCAIASYLDDETERIDKLIAMRQHTLSLYTERLQNVVSNLTHAAAAVSEAHVLPSGWSRVPLGRCLKSSCYGIGTPTEVSGRYAVLGMSNVLAGEIVGEPSGFISEVDDALLLSVGDLLFNRTNSRELVGKVAIVRHLEKPTTFASYLVCLRTNHLVEPRYLNYLLNTNEILGLARSMALPSVGQANLNPTRYSAMVLPIPPRTEQERLVSKFESMARRTKEVANLLGRQVTLLKSVARLLSPLLLPISSTFRRPRELGQRETSRG